MCRTLMFANGLSFEPDAIPGLFANDARDPLVHRGRVDTHPRVRAGAVNSAIADDRDQSARRSWFSSIVDEGRRPGIAGTHPAWQAPHSPVVVDDLLQRTPPEAADAVPQRRRGARSRPDPAGGSLN